MLFLMAPDPFSEVGDFSKLSPSDRRQAEFGAAQTASMKHSLSEYGGYWVELPGTAHNDFSDIPLYSPFRFLTHAGPGDPVRTSRIIRRYMLAFFDQFLKGIEHPLLRGPSPEYPQLRFQAWTPKVRNAHVAAPANQKQ